MRHEAILVLETRRFRDVHAPRARDLRRRLDRGECLSDFDLAYLFQTLAECRTVGRHAAGVPEWQDICVRVVALYRSLIARAVDNELARP
jgi:hypothetical protein